MARLKLQTKKAEEQDMMARNSRKLSNIFHTGMELSGETYQRRNLKSSQKKRRWVRPWNQGSTAARAWYVHMYDKKSTPICEERNYHQYFERFHFHNLNTYVYISITYSRVLVTMSYSYCISEEHNSIQLKIVFSLKFRCHLPWLQHAWLEFSGKLEYFSASGLHLGNSPGTTSP